jgi:HAD superfamily hydrolase (TIGR01458 family)
MKYRGLLFDLDGVFHVSDRLLPGAVETLQLLRERRIPFRIVTNTTTRSRASLVARMNTIGLPLRQSDLITAPYAAALHLQSLRSPRCRFVVTDDVRTEFVAFTDDEASPQFIVLGDFEDQVSYPLLNSIFNQMMLGAELIALHKGRFWETSEGLKVDLGLFVAGLEYTTGKRATIIGKPSVRTFEIALKELGLEGSECAMIGDDLHNDVGGAQAAGMAGILIRTGKYRPGYEFDSKVTPDEVVHDLNEVAKLLS